MHNTHQSQTSSKTNVPGCSNPDLLKDKKTMGGRGVCQLKKLASGVLLAVVALSSQPAAARDNQWVPVAVGALVGTAAVAGAVIASQQNPVVVYPQPMVQQPMPSAPPVVYVQPPVVFRPGPNIYTAPFWPPRGW